LLAVNAFKPYPLWRRFKYYIEVAWEGLKKVIEIKGLERIGLRYINQIALSTPRVHPEEFLRFYLFVSQQLPQQIVSFLAGAEFSFVDDRDRCRVQLASPFSSGDKTTFMLDIDYFLERPCAVAVADALEWVEEAHSRVEEIFEGCITDRLREIFQEVR
jgi:uncharacterized protein (TIGR04255 family)